MRRPGRFRREIKNGEKKDTAGAPESRAQPRGDGLLMEMKERQALLSRVAGDGSRALRGSFRAKLLILDVREDLDPGRGPL